MPAAAHSARRRGAARPPTAGAPRLLEGVRRSGRAAAAGGSSDAAAPRRRPRAGTVPPSRRRSSPSAAARPQGERLGGPLPEAVRARVVALAAEALGALPAAELPARLRPFARWAPPRRATLAASQLASALEAEPVFRQQVGEHLASRAPDLAAASRRGAGPAAADPVDVAAAAYLLRPRGWTATLRTVAAQLDRRARLDRERDLGAEVSRLSAALQAARERAASEVAAALAGGSADRAEVARLRRELGLAREAARSATRRAADAEARRAAVEAELAAERATADREALRLRERLAAAEAALETSRRTAREGRTAADARVLLLLETVQDAARGLRRELDLSLGGPAPADLVAAQARLPQADGVTPRGLAADSVALLDALLTLPRVHLVVDGYNVTKGGYGELPLQTQRSRLLTGLGALAAASGAEVTCVFDGADVQAVPATMSPRGVRVLFSTPPEIADELIRRLVRAEPRGRPVVVASSDREVVDGVVAAGARAVPAAALLRRLER